MVNLILNEYIKKTGYKLLYYSGFKKSYNIFIFNTLDEGKQ